MSDSLQKRYDKLQNAIQNTVSTFNNAKQNVNLIAVSKTFPASDIKTLYDLGQRNFGENYIQEWCEKYPTLPEDIVWHIIGDIQSNKTRIVAENADWVHTLSRIKIAERLSQARPVHLPKLNVCIEVNISGETQKHGISLDEVIDFAKYVQNLPQLNLRGLMCITANADEITVRSQMQKMQDLFNQMINEDFLIDTLSMGMSNDWKLAIEYGATHIRIGSALFGLRK
ncbi:MAG: YggS family pyridoxal phosphate-dependent enzyme [Neisseriaceae bacterium]|nr:YggS family pyridoxal phosphate-dependent enzyme [Neisseriaceae bacterium]